jgi:Na+/proline symporter
MSLLDWVVIGIYFSALVGIVWWSSRRQRTSTDCFLAGRDVAWVAVGASIFASNIGSEHVVGLAGSGANNGLAQAHWELQAWILLLGWIFAPFYYHAGVFTMPEFLEKRFNLVSAALVIAISLATPPEPAERLRGLTYGSLTPEQRARNRASVGWADVAGSGAILALVLGTYLYFSFWI